MLALKVPVKTDEEDHDANPQKGGAERFTQVAELGGGVGVKGCRSEDLVEESGGSVVRRVIDGIFLSLQGCLYVIIYLGVEARTHERAEGQGSCSVSAVKEVV